MRMTEKRYTTMWKPETTFSRFWIVRENWERKLNANDVVDLLNELHEENVQLKQFQEQVASVIEGKMGDNVCNDYKMEVLKEIWNELELDELWFE